MGNDFPLFSTEEGGKQGMGMVFMVREFGGIVDGETEFAEGGGEGGDGCGYEIVIVGKAACR